MSFENKLEEAQGIVGFYVEDKLRRMFIAQTLRSHMQETHRCLLLMTDKFTFNRMRLRKLKTRIWNEYLSKLHMVCVDGEGLKGVLWNKVKETTEKQRHFMADAFYQR